MEMYNFIMMLWKAVFSLQSNVGKDTFWNPTMDVASFPNRFCISLDYPRLVGLATTGHIRSLMIFSVNVISIFPFVKIY